MIVYNHTTKVDHEIEEEWISWQKENYIPEVMATGFCNGFHFYKLLCHDDEEGRTFVIQFFSASKENYEKYLHEFAPGLRKKSQEKCGDHVIAYRSLLKELA
jgi:hypothetical protein